MMHKSRLKRWPWLASLLAVCFCFAAEQSNAQPKPEEPAPADGKQTEGVEVQTRGPIHEAFAGIVSFHPEAGPIATKAPPADIEELPPDQRPDGENVAWIPGYWAWDDERGDYLWISGIWRALPPGRQWIPGYWSGADQKFQWTSGYWADANQADTEYLPEPPATIEQGPSADAPSPDQVWIPGNWIWNQSRYAWQPGYWAAPQQNWLWIPSTYYWSPRGYVYVNGYWDYSVARRGLLFAPVYFNANVYSRPGFSYSPFAVVNAGVFANQLFLRPNYQHYYFGDYYASSYGSAGFYPWFSFSAGGYGYDPFFAQQRWVNRQNANWSKTIEANYKSRVDHEDARPARTLADQQSRAKGAGKEKGDNLATVTPLDQLGKNQDNDVKIRKIDKAEREQLAKQSHEVRQYQASRQKAEAKSENTADAKSDKAAERQTAKLAKSPILAKADGAGGKDGAPPKPHETPKPDMKAEPKARSNADRTKPEKGTPNPAKADTKPGAPKDEPKPATPRDEPKADPKPAPKDRPKPMPMPKADPKPEPTPKNPPKVNPKPEPMPMPKVEPKPEPAPKTPPKANPKREPNPAPKADPQPKPAPKVAPKAKPAPQPAPKAEPKPQPKKSDS